MLLMRSELGDHATGPRATLRLLANTAALSELLPQHAAGVAGAQSASIWT
ncbi:hypothetical protein PE067_00100 [Paracoccus sp. DMF-8]|nr:hypothetical protein [Paracoccus sp. DMF-8]MDF3604697.1 hypothetical protein [Paracoccus sp. DMF-8]